MRQLFVCFKEMTFKKANHASFVDCAQVQRDFKPLWSKPP